MSDTIHLACVTCRKTLWIGQGGYRAPTKAYLYAGDHYRDNFTRFYDAHRGHDIRLTHMEGLDTLGLLEDGCDSEDDDELKPK